jgi:hypothetical protein
MLETLILGAFVAVSVVIGHLVWELMKETI